MKHFNEMVQRMFKSVKRGINWGEGRKVKLKVSKEEIEMWKVTSRLREINRINSVLKTIMEKNNMK
jgi:hypothetical protein